jgi:NitT/TauT family transport system ATP-binding protein
VLGDRVLVLTARLGRVKEICDVGAVFPRPRRVEEVKSSPEYGELFGRVWGQLREEVLQATAPPEVSR